jgi:hypothetical protein
LNFIPDLIHLNSKLKNNNLMKTSIVCEVAVTSKEMSFPRLLLSGAVDSCSVSPLLKETTTKLSLWYPPMANLNIQILKFQGNSADWRTSYSLLEDLNGSRLMACSTGWAGGLRVVGVRLAPLPPAVQATLRGQSHVCNSWLENNQIVRLLSVTFHRTTPRSSDVSIIRLIGRFHQRKASFAYALLL